MTGFRLADVYFSYGLAPVLAGVSLEVGAGETVALLGQNGAGKTTLTRLVVGLLHPNRGAVWIDDETTDGKAPEDLADRVAYVFQHPDQQLFARTVLDEVAFGPRQSGLDGASAAAAARAALAQVGLEEYADTHPYDLPPAQRKLVTVAAAVAQQPRVLVLDEPTQGLDRAATRHVTAIIERMATTGVAVLAVTHDSRFVAETLERTVVLAAGAIQADGPSGGLLRDQARVAALDLVPPPAARLSLALGLPGTPYRERDVIESIAHRYGSRVRAKSDGSAKEGATGSHS